MAITTLAAVGLAAAGAGAFLGGRAQARGAKQASNIARDTATENNALTRDIYAQNKEALSPYSQTGIPAGFALNSFLGLAPTQQQTQQQPNAISQFGGQQLGGQSYGFEGMDGPQGGYYGANSVNGAPFGGGGFGSPNGYYNPQGTPFNPQTQQQPMVNGRDAFRTFIDNSDYGFQFGEGANRVNSGYAGQGTLQSGAAMKGLEDYRQNLQQGYRGEFLNLLGNQQGVGLSGASALAGVGQNFVNTISANNNSAGTAAANAALVKGANNPFANALSLVGGGLFGRGK